MSTGGYVPFAKWCHLNILFFALSWVPTGRIRLCLSGVSRAVRAKIDIEAEMVEWMKSLPSFPYIDVECSQLYKQTPISKRPSLLSYLTHATPAQMLAKLKRIGVNALLTRAQHEPQELLEKIQLGSEMLHHKMPHISAALDLFCKALDPKGARMPARGHVKTSIIVRSGDQTRPDTPLHLSRAEADSTWAFMRASEEGRKAIVIIRLRVAEMCAAMERLQPRSAITANATEGKAVTSKTIQSTKTKKSKKSKNKHTRPRRPTSTTQRKTPTIRLTEHKDKKGVAIFRLTLAKLFKIGLRIFNRKQRKFLKGQVVMHCPDQGTPTSLIDQEMMDIVFFGDKLSEVQDELWWSTGWWINSWLESLNLGDRDHGQIHGEVTSSRIKSLSAGCSSVMFVRASVYICVREVQVRNKTIGLVSYEYLCG